MKSKIAFSIKNLLIGYENPKGPITQMLFAQSVSKQVGMDFFNRLARLKFADPTINRAVSGAVPLEETLLIGHEGVNDLILYMYVRSGQGACEVATGYFPDREIFIHDDYRHAIMLGKLSDNDIRNIFSYIWDNIDLIQPKGA